jgi:uncharacterized protein YggU (UPF0235/DUF167 family)
MIQKYKEILAHDKKIILKLKIHARAKQTRLKSILSDGTIKIDIAIEPTDNKANEVLFKLLAQEFQVKLQNISILYGQFSADKTILINLE